LLQKMIFCWMDIFMFQLTCQKPSHWFNDLIVWICKIHAILKNYLKHFVSSVFAMAENLWLYAREEWWFTRLIIKFIRPIFMRRIKFSAAGFTAPGITYDRMRILNSRNFGILNFLRERASANTSHTLAHHHNVRFSQRICQRIHTSNKGRLTRRNVRRFASFIMSSRYI